MADAKKGGKGGDKKPAAGPKGKRGAYKVEGGKLVRLRKTCPKCGPGVFLGEHKDRVSCGNCGYTEFKQAKAA
ncbi:MAG: 30S ribosomal protein S27ae [Thermoplasmatota archaeon]